MWVNYYSGLPMYGVAFECTHVDKTASNTAIDNTNAAYGLVQPSGSGQTLSVILANFGNEALTVSNIRGFNVEAAFPLQTGVSDEQTVTIEIGAIGSEWTVSTVTWNTRPTFSTTLCSYDINSKTGSFLSYAEPTMIPTLGYAAGETFLPHGVYAQLQVVPGQPGTKIIGNARIISGVNDMRTLNKRWLDFMDYSTSTL